MVPKEIKKYINVLNNRKSEVDNIIETINNIINEFHEIIEGGNVITLIRPFLTNIFKKHVDGDYRNEFGTLFRVIEGDLNYRKYKQHTFYSASIFDKYNNKEVYSFLKKFEPELVDILKIIVDDMDKLSKFDECDKEIILKKTIQKKIEFLSSDEYLTIKKESFKSFEIALAKKYTHYNYDGIYNYIDKIYPSYQEYLIDEDYFNTYVELLLKAKEFFEALKKDANTYKNKILNYLVDSKYNAEFAAAQI